jgi:hypothetical protein
MDNEKHERGKNLPASFEPIIPRVCSSHQDDTIAVCLFIFVKLIITYEGCVLSMNSVDGFRLNLVPEVYTESHW